MYSYLLLNNKWLIYSLLLPWPVVFTPLFHLWNDWLIEELARMSKYVGVAGNRNWYNAHILCLCQPHQDLISSILDLDDLTWQIGWWLLPPALWPPGAVQSDLCLGWTRALSLPGIRTQHQSSRWLITSLNHALFSILTSFFFFSHICFQRESGGMD